ncbi:MAG: hypothetical protein ABSB90_09130 [Thermoplasmata archaeon]|jgi:hypothetical protein
MMLYPGEVPICSEQMYAWAPPQQVPGTLYLTNLRLVFEAASGAYGQQYGLELEQALGLSGPPAAQAMLNLEVRSITNVAATPAPSGWHTLRVEANGGAFVYNFQTPRADSWVASIQGARGAAPLPSSAPPPAPAPYAAPTAAPPAVSAPPAAAPRPSSAPPAAAGGGGGTAWCMRCGKGNPAGAPQCAGCGAKLG